jgi:hypothetical protein
MVRTSGPSGSSLHVELQAWGLPGTGLRAALSSADWLAQGEGFQRLKLSKANLPKGTVMVALLSLERRPSTNGISSGHITVYFRNHFLGFRLPDDVIVEDDVALERGQTNGVDGKIKSERPVTP